MTGYSVEILWHPGLELLVSLETYASARLHKVTDFGAPWRAQVRQGLPKELANRLDSISGTSEDGRLLEIAHCLAWSCPPGVGTVEGFLQWASEGDIQELGCVSAKPIRPDEQSADEIEELRGRAEIGERSDWAEIEDLRDRAVGLMREWHRHYFAGVHPAILTGLSEEARRQRQRVSTTDPELLVEELSGGIVLKPAPSFSRVVVAPQYHARPWNLNGRWGETCSVLYPAEVLAAAPGDPPIRLVRLTKALDDKTRLRILKLVAREPLSLTEIARRMGLTKPTVHHHLVLLRAAGLLRVQTSFAHRLDGRFVVRSSALSDLSQDLESFLGGVVT